MADRSRPRNGVASPARANSARRPTAFGGDADVSSGRHILHARYPWPIAFAASPKNSTFSRRGSRARQTGRQKIPVVRTATMNTPSNDGSFSRNALHIVWSEGSAVIMSDTVRCPPRGRRHFSRDLFEFIEPDRYATRRPLVTRA